MYYDIKDKKFTKCRYVGVHDEDDICVYTKENYAFVKRALEETDTPFTFRESEIKRKYLRDDCVTKFNQIMNNRDKRIRFIKNEILKLNEYGFIENGNNKIYFIGDCYLDDSLFDIKIIKCYGFSFIKDLKSSEKMKVLEFKLDQGIYSSVLQETIYDKLSNYGLLSDDANMLKTYGIKC